MLLNQWIGLKHMFAAPKWDQRFHESPAEIDRVQDFQTKLLAQHKVLLAVSWCGVNAARSLFQRDVVGRQKNRIAIDEGVFGV